MKLSQIDFRYKPKGQSQDLKEGKTTLKLEVQSGKKNSLSSTLKLAFLNYKEECPYFFITLRAKEDPGKLAKAVDKFLTNIMLLIEMMSRDSYDKHLTQINYKVTQINNKVILILDLGNDMTKDFVKEFDYIFKIFTHVKPNLAVKFKSYVDFKDVTPKNVMDLKHLELDENHDVIIPEEEQPKTKFTEPNLFDMILKGFTLTAKLTCSSHVKETLKSITSKLLEEFGRPILRMGIADNANELAAKILPEKEEDIYKNFEFDNLKDKINDVIKDKDIHFPDGVDIIDELGALLNEMSKPLEMAPFVMEFLEDLREHAIADAEAGIVHRSTKISVSGKTSGLKEIYDAVMCGVVDVEVDDY